VLSPCVLSVRLFRIKVSKVGWVGSLSTKHNFRKICRRSYEARRWILQGKGDITYWGIEEWKKFAAEGRICLSGARLRDIYREKQFSLANQLSRPLKKKYRRAAISNRAKTSARLCCNESRAAKQQQPSLFTDTRTPTAALYPPDLQQAITIQHGSCFALILSK
jgi:hypothetical protein